MTRDELIIYIRNDPKWRARREARAIQWDKKWAKHIEEHGIVKFTCPHGLSGAPDCPACDSIH